MHAPTAGAQEAAAPVEPAPGDISGLIRAVADATGRLEGAKTQIAVKREDVNKTLVDLQLSRVDLDHAIEASDQAVRDREKADTDLGTAQSTLQDYAGTLYRQGTAPGAASALLDPAAPSEAGRRQELLGRAGADQHDVVDRLQKARNDAGDRERQAGDALGEAQRRHDDAESRRDQAQRDIGDVGGQVKDLQGQVTDLQGKLDAATRALAASGGGAQQPTVPDPAGPATGTDPGREVEQDQNAARDEAVRQLSADPQADQRAEDVALALPSHLDLSGIRALGTGSAGARKAADSARRGLGGTIDAGSVGDAVAAGRKGDTDALVQQVVDAVTKAGTGSAGDTAKTKPAGPGTTAGQSGAGNDDEEDDGTDEGADTPSTNTAPEKPSSGNAQKDVETVVNRAKSQLGKPYAWGGGDAKGPTKGIHDGGVADSYGDFNKVGFDCSGLMIYAFAGVGKSLAHYTGYQYEAGTQVPVSQRKRGDMLFWDGHVALYIGDGKMIEAPESGEVVKISPVRTAGLWPNAVRMID